MKSVGTVVGLLLLSKSVVMQSQLFIHPRYNSSADKNFYQIHGTIRSKIKMQRYFKSCTLRPNNRIAKCNGHSHYFVVIILSLTYLLLHIFTFNFSNCVKSILFVLIIFIKLFYTKLSIF
jgi:hypothetical protein